MRRWGGALLLLGGHFLWVGLVDEGFVFFLLLVLLRISFLLVISRCLMLHLHIHSLLLRRLQNNIHLHLSRFLLPLLSLLSDLLLFVIPTRRWLLITPLLILLLSRILSSLLFIHIFIMFALFIISE